MIKAKLKGVLALLLATLMAAGVLPFGVAAADDDTSGVAATTAAETVVDANGNTQQPKTAEATNSATANGAEAQETSVFNEDEYRTTYDKETVEKLVSAEPYIDYTTKYASVPVAKQTLTYDASETYNEELSSSGAYICEASEHGDGTEEGDCLYTSGAGETVFDIDIPETGMYAIRLTYTSVIESNDATSEIATTIERMLYVDDELPFSEARYFYLPRVWQYEYQKDDAGNLSFIKDKNGNDTRPRRNESERWQTYYLRDWLGYEIDPLQFYFSEGHHTVTLVSNRESMVIKNIELYPYEEEPLYEDWLEEKLDDGVKVIDTIEPIKIQTEDPESVSVQNVFPGNDRTSSLTEPQDPAVIKYNILENGTVNNWMKYDVEVPETGLYSVVFRFRQNSLIGMFTSRRMRVNGEVQFREASYLRFMYNTGFQVTEANNGDQQFMFYFEKGKNTVELEIVLGEMVDFVYGIEQCKEDLNEVYQKMLMITGPVPDTYRDYGFNRLVPECIETIAKSADLLYDMEQDIVEMTGEQGDQSNALKTIATLLETMATNEYEIAPNFLTFKNYIISLSDWLYAALAQPIKLDYFMLQGKDDKLPKAQSTFLQRSWFEVQAFVASFTMDYTTIGFTEDKSTTTTDTFEMWSMGDRESMLILRYIVDNNFTPETGISLRIKVISAGLTEAILAGVGPDVSFMDVTNTITWGMRTAIIPLEEMDGFDEVSKEFDPSFLRTLTMTGQDNVWHTYGMPTTCNINMAFYRIDVLNELGLAIPNTWSDLYTMFPTLLNNRLDVGIPTAFIGNNLFLYQQEGGELYADDGYRINLDNNTSLSAFKSLCDMFTKYSCPVEYDITRFRTGEVPIMISNDAITIYNQLMTFYELRGLWQMEPLIGTVQSDGSLNRNSCVITQAMMIPRGGYDPDVVWKFVEWYVSSEGQTRLARETIAVSAPTTKHSTANREALLAQKWTTQERAAITEQLDNLAGVPEYPGSYIVGTYVTFAFQEAYNNGTDPSEAMLDQILDINKEISRKRKEFGLDAYDISYSGQFTSSDEEESESGD